MDDKQVIVVDKEEFLKLLAEAKGQREDPRAAVDSLRQMDGHLYFEIDHDPEWGMSDAFAEALCEHARRTDCGASPPPDLSPCLCRLVADSNRLEYRVDEAIWRTELLPLWKREQRRVYDWRSQRARSEAKKNSPDPSHTAADIAMLGSIQGDACYYCGASIIGNCQVEHLKPLARGGSNGVANIMLACPRCNREKWIHSEEKFWRKQKRRLLPEEFARVREAAKAMKKERNRILRGRKRGARTNQHNADRRIR